MSRAKFVWTCRTCGRSRLSAHRPAAPRTFISIVPMHCGLPCVSLGVPVPLKASAPRLRKVGTHHFVTLDGAYEVLGSDVGTRPPAGAVWSWRTSKPPLRPTYVTSSTWEWTDDMHHFSSKAACLVDLNRHIGGAA